MAQKPKRSSTAARGAAAKVAPKSTSLEATRRALVALVNGYLMGRAPVIESAVIVETDKPKLIRINWNVAKITRAKRATKLAELTRKLAADPQIPVTGHYDPAEAGKTTLTYQGHTFTIILKPGNPMAALRGVSQPTTVTLGAGLYPKNFGVTGKDYSLPKYKQDVHQRLQQYPQEDFLHEFLPIMFEAAGQRGIHGPGVSLPLSETTLNGDSAPMVITTKVRSKIENEFGEVLGPVMVSSHPKYPNVGGIYFSNSMVESGYDFKLDWGTQKAVQFSSKAGSSTKPNTLKSKDIIPWFQAKERRNDLSDTERHEAKTLKNSKEYKILEQLFSNDAQLGPKKAIEAAGLMDNYKQFLRKRPKDKPQGDSLQNQYTFLEQASLPGMLSWQNLLNYRELFLFVTKGNVVFIKTHLNVTVREGAVFRCTIFDPTGTVKAEFRPYLRAKPLNAGRASEKVGLTPP